MWGRGPLVGPRATFDRGVWCGAHMREEAVCGPSDRRERRACGPWCLGHLVGCCPQGWLSRVGSECEWGAGDGT